MIRDLATLVLINIAHGSAATCENVIKHSDNQDGVGDLMEKREPRALLMEVFVGTSGNLTR